MLHSIGIIKSMTGTDVTGGDNIRSWVYAGNVSQFRKKLFREILTRPKIIIENDVCRLNFS